MPLKGNNNENNKLSLNKYQILKQNPNMCVQNQRKLNQKNSTVELIWNNNSSFELLF